MKKNDLITSIAERTGIKSSTVRAILDAMLDIITEELEDGGKVDIFNFGKFVVNRSKDRMGINPSNGDKLLIRGRNRVSFKPHKYLKDKVNP